MVCIPSAKESPCFSAGCEPTQRLQSREKEVRAAAHGRERREARDLSANRPLRNLEFERSVLRANDRIPLVPELVEVPVVDPDVLRKFVLPDEAPTDHERRDTPFLAIVRRTLREIRP